MFSSVLLLDLYTFKFFKFLKYIYKISFIVGGRASCPQRQGSHYFSLFFLLYCSMFCIFRCKCVFFSSVPHCVQCFFLLPSICYHPSCTQKSYCLQTESRNSFEGSDALLSLVIRQFFAEAELLTIFINIIICEDVL